MASYRPLYIRKPETGLVQNRQNFILPDDAFPVLENAYVWREQLKRKQGYQLLARLRRVIDNGDLGISGASPWSFNIYSTLTPAITGESNAEIQIGSISIDINGVVLIDQGDGTLETSPVSAVSGTIDYYTGDVVITGNALGDPTLIDFSYYPTLPAMGARSRQLNGINAEELVMFDTKYAYRIGVDQFEEFLPGTTWTGTDFEFFWTTNWFVDSSNRKVFWATNFSGTAGDPIRYTNGVPGTNWYDFAPQINAAADKLNQCLALLPFRGRLIAFNTLEGQDLASSVAFFQRVRWSAIGTPFTTVSAIVSDVNVDAWRDDIRGQGGFLDIPTTENITSVGFVRDNLVIYCESSTWQLRYTGRSIAPFQIEKVNTELGAESTFSAVQFDTSLVGIGDKGIVECDSFKSNRIDIKIPDLVFQFSNTENGIKRVHGIRDFFNRLAYWTYPYNPTDNKFPDRRLVYNYENDSWAIFTDSLTCLGSYQAEETRIWEDQEQSWEESDFSWYDSPTLFPDNVGGNQQGYVLILDKLTVNQQSLSIQGILGQTPLPTQLDVPNHNLQTGQIIKITDIVSGTPFASSLNDNIFYVQRIDADTLNLFIYNPTNGQFSLPQEDSPAVYVGGGQITVRDNFKIQSKKFNFLEEGQTIVFGYIDLLTVVNEEEDAAFSMNVYIEYADEQPVNVKPENIDAETQSEDTFFNSIVPTFLNSNLKSSKSWQRVFCNTRGSFVMLEYTFNNGQMAGSQQENEIQIDAQILWIRPGGSQLPFGF